MPRISRYAPLPVSDLTIERFQARKSNTGTDLEELAASIEKWGLLQPIVVCKSLNHPTKWEIVCGQRRYLACVKILQRSEIMAGIIDEPVSVGEGYALSASENVVRLDMTRKDLIDLCMVLFKRYGTIKDVASETKLPYPICRKYIRYDGLPQDLKAKVDSNEVSVNLAMKIQDVASGSGSYDQDESNALVNKLKTVDNPIQKKILKLRKHHPDADLEKLVEEAEKPDLSMRLSLVIGEELAQPLKRYSNEQELDEKEAVLDFIEDSLERHGYLEG
jgi:ParB family chromosome partitioning protein